MSPAVAAETDGLAVICGGGSLPFALAEAAARRGRRVVLLALRGWADPERVAAFRHHWIWIGQMGRLRRLAAAEACRDVLFIGSVVRPSLWTVRPDFEALRLLPEMVRLYRGGDDRVNAGIGRIFERHGLRVLGVRDVAPELMMPDGLLGRIEPDDACRADIAQGLDLLRATSPFDIGQAAVVGVNQVLAVEGPEGTDRMLQRVAELRASGRIRTPRGRGVLVKAPKIGQDQRIDLPVIGPSTLAAAAQAGLAGIAVVAGSTVVAEAETLAAAADRAGLFVVGVAESRP